MNRLRPKARLWIVAFHLVSIGGWLGSSFVLLMLSFIALLSGNRVVEIAIPDIMHLIDLLIIIPASLGIIVTGILLSALTPWGFIKHWWIIAKELGTLFLVVLGAVWLSPLVFQAMHMTAEYGTAILSSPDYRMIHIKILWTSIIVLPLLIGMIVISKLKPWGKVRKWGARVQRI